MIDKTNVGSLTYSIFFDNNKFNRNKIKESWIKSHYPIDYLNIGLFHQEKKLKLDIFSQKVYHYILNLTEIPICLKCNKNLQRYKGFNIGYDNFCSKSCASSNSFKSGYKKRVINTIEKYGVKHTSQLKSVKDKIKSTNLERHGVEYAAQNPDILNKIKETNIDRYGVEFPLQNKSIYKKLVDSGVTSWSNLPKNIKYRKENSLLKYGVEWPIQSNEVKEKIKVSKTKSISIKIEELYEKNDSVDFIEYKDGMSKFKCLICEKNFDISSSLLYQRHIKHDITICTHCNKLNDRTTSGHLEICNYLQEIGINYKINVRDIPYEIDIYLPDNKIGIEFNGIYWHSEIIKEKNYHIKKRKNCISKGIDLIQIWEDDWKYKKDIIKSIISSRLKKSSSVKWSRKLKIERIRDENLVKDFLNTNHLQGWSLSAIKYGLFEGDDLISIMTFSKSRINVNSSGWELVRFCNKINYTVLGSFNKLIKKFIKDNSPESLISYSDNDIFNGESYERFDMSKSMESPNYWWCDGKIRHNRWKFRKDILVKEGNDKSLTSTEIMINKGYFRCWGSGTTRWGIKF